MKSANAPLTWKTTFSFVSLVTLIVLLIGWLTSAGVLPIKRVIDYSDTEVKFIQVWIWLAIAIGLLLPGIAFLIWINRPEPRNILGFYLLVLIIQIVSEQVFSSIWFPSLVVPIGILYTAFRLWQLWQGQKLIRITTQLSRLNHTMMSGLLWLSILFWASNLIMLLVLPLPSIL
ncbi:hypothetical protein FNW02_04855 [Komarekiella sp. 'clone 1']|uniref:Uncharacterized protein n=1 Tax=Komarekiella delphini-convector SJRDD-AB1 TaxID=2593771 RepID=A0AA40VPX4_9NOST|nr:hypothetical protein [Komarekiella delphini-convector]MBD6615197.1 hypothetical protein [Komarekiella delphini-convector SJRDD-AB1]